MHGNLLNNILSALKQAKNHNYKALDHIIENGNEEVDETQLMELSCGILSSYYFDKNITINEKEIVAREIARSSNKKVIEHYSNFLFKDENLSIVPMFFASKEYIKVMLKNQDALKKLKKLKIELKGLNVEINFFTAVACAVKEKKLLKDLLASKDIENMYTENLQDKNNDPLYGLLQVATLSGNIKFIDIFLNKSESAVLKSEEIYLKPNLSRSSSQDLGIDEGSDFDPSSDTSDTEDDFTEADSGLSSRANTPISECIAYESAGEEESLDSGVDSGTSTPSNRSEIDLSETEEFNLSDHQEGFKKSLLEILEVAISQEKYEVIESLYKRFNETKVLKIKEVFITAVQDQKIKEALEKQETTRPGSVKVHDLMNKWFLDIELERKFAAINEKKEVKRKLYGNQKSVLDVITELIIKIKNMINEIINYFYPSKDIEEQLSTPAPQNNVSSSVQKNCDDRAVINQSIPHSNIDSVSTTSNSKCNYLLQV